MKSRPYGLAPSRYRPALLLTALLLALLAGCATPYEVDEDGYTYVSAASVDEIRWQRVDAGCGLSYKIPAGAQRQEALFEPDDEDLIELGNYTLALANFDDLQTLSFVIYLSKNKGGATLDDILHMEGKTPEEWLGSPGEESYAYFRYLHDGHVMDIHENTRYGGQRFVEMDRQAAHIISWISSPPGSFKNFLTELQMPVPGYRLHITFFTSYSPDAEGRAALAFAHAFIDEFIAGFKIDPAARPFARP